MVRGYYYLLFVALLVTLVRATSPLIYFSDINNGQNKGNSDTSKGQTINQHGALVTIWGVNLGSTQGSSKVYVNGVEAAVYYQWSNALFPANLYNSHGMQMVIFQIAATTPVGPTTIYAVVNGVNSNTIPFTVRTADIYYVATSGLDSAAGTYQAPFKTIPHAISSKMVAGDTVYVMNGVVQNTLDRYSAALDLFITGTADMPNALVGYPGAQVSIGSDSLVRAIHNFASDIDDYASYWTVSRISVVAGTDIGIALYTGCRGVGNYINMPNSQGDDGGVLGWGSNMFVLGNEFTNMSAQNSGTVSKLQHVIYIQSARSDTPPRLPTEENRTIAYNYLHDNYMNRGINIYSEQAYAGFMKNHYVHDNVVLRQRGPGILLGYYMTGDVMVYNNLIDQAGLGPEPSDGSSGHACIEMNAGYDSTQATNVYLYNNILSRCGFDSTTSRGVTGGLQWTPQDGVTVKFSNNIFYQTNNSPYMATDSALPSTNGNDKNLYYGNGNAPTFDTHGITADPLFTDINNFNFRLKTGSPGLASGNNYYQYFTRDLSGAPRPQTANFDMGVYQTTGNPDSSSSSSGTSSSSPASSSSSASPASSTGSPVSSSGTSGTAASSNSGNGAASSAGSGSHTTTGNSPAESSNAICVAVTLFHLLLFVSYLNMFILFTYIYF